MLPVGEFDTVSPTWMPDGKSIVFLDSTGGSVRNVKMVDTTTLQVTVISDSKNLTAPVVSPDGRHIAGPSVDSQKLLLYDFGSRTWSELLKMNVGCTNWSQDSKYIYFDTGLSEDPAFYRVRVADKKLERMADLKGFRRVVFGWLPWSGVTPDGAPLLLRDISSQEVYALDFETP
jgi:Tol biopolymer transport system component